MWTCPPSSAFVCCFAVTFIDCEWLGLGFGSRAQPPRGPLVSVNTSGSPSPHAFGTGDFWGWKSAEWLTQASLLLFSWISCCQFLNSYRGPRVSTVSPLGKAWGVLQPLGCPGPLCGMAPERRVCCSVLPAEGTLSEAEDQNAKDWQQGELPQWHGLQKWRGIRGAGLHSDTAFHTDCAIKVGYNK